MPTVTREDISEVSTVITVEINQTDYQPKVKKKLQEVQRETSIKGFRPGQAPVNFIRKRFGNGIMSDIIENQVRESLGNFFKEQKMTYLAQPLPRVSNNYNYNIEQPQDFVFKFDMGIVPEFDIQGTDLDNVLPFYDIAIDESFLQKEIDRLRERFSTGFEENITTVEEKDMVFVQLDELDASGEVKAKGVTRAEVPFFVKDLNETLRAQVMNMAIGDTVDTNIYEAEPQRKKEFVEKQILQITPKTLCGTQFRLTLLRIQRPKKAELSEQFYQQLFPNDEVADVNTFEDKMRDELYKVYKQLATQRFFGTIYTSLMDKNKITLPIEFLKQYLTATEPNLPADFFETAQFEGMVNDIRWGLLRDRLAARFEIEVTKEEVEDTVRLEILRYFNYQIPPYSDYVNQQIARILGDRREFQKRYEATMDERVLEQVSELVGKDVKAVTKDEFDALDKKTEEVAADSTEVTAE
jgi:trigger factor